MTIDARPVLEVDGLVKHYPVKGGLFARGGKVQALSGVSFAIARGETLALVGESGCGKSTLARCVMRLEEPTAGTIMVDGRDALKALPRELRRLRRKMQIIFQNPYASLNPRWSVATLIADPMRLHKIVPRKQRREHVARLLETVGLGPEFMDRHPHELSGGQRQRIAIARALAMQPEILVCDEPVSSLDVSIQAQVINLLKRLQAQFQLSYLFISHDLALVLRISDRIAVMYLGEIVELADTSAMRKSVKHPYSQALFSAAPVADPDAWASRKRIVLAGDVPSPIDPPKGCRFHTRCPYRQSRCMTEVPELRPVEGHLVRCHFSGPGFPPPVGAPPPG